MRFYGRLSKLSAITFDLDDTLYNNSELIRKTLVQTQLALRQWHPKLAQSTPEEFQRCRQQIAAQDPSLVHDVTQWRHRTLMQLMQQAGLSDTESECGSAAVMEVFHHWRSAITLPAQSLETLEFLSQRLPLAVITNGNACPKRLGIADHFQVMLRAGPDGRAKPWADMFQAAARRLGVPAAEILHVGDDPITDVAGAKRAGLQSCWLNDQGADLRHLPSARLLPDLEISRLDSLTSLL